MRIAIDAHVAGTQHAGVVTVIENLIEALASLDRANQYTIYLTEKNAISRYANRWPNFEVRHFRARSRYFRFFYGFPQQLRKYPADILLCQFNAPPSVRCKVVAIIHDLSFIRVPETFPIKMRMQMQIMTRRTSMIASHIIAPSEYSRRDIINAYNVPENRVTRVPLAPPDWFEPVKNEGVLDDIKRKYALPNEYILGLGSIQPRKNLARLIEAYASLVKRGIEIPKLVLAGKLAWLSEATVQSAAFHDVVDRVIFTGHISEEDLPALYSGAKCFVYPSYFEGFGLPPLEAMRCGTPVITGNLTSLPEVVGVAALMVDPFEVTSIAKGLERVVSDTDLRESMRQKGAEQAAKFSWERTAGMTLRILEQVHSDVIDRADTMTKSASVRHSG